MSSREVLKAQQLQPMILDRFFNKSLVKFIARWVHFLVTPPTSFGVLEVLNSLFPGSSRSGEKQQKYLYQPENS